VGLLLPQYGASTSEAQDSARACDAAGLDIWLAGQVTAISGSATKTALEPLSLMGAVAAVTTRSRLGFMALAAPYLPAAYLAKALATLDQLSGGRLEVGLGAGWRVEEFDLLGLPFGDFRARTGAVRDVIEALSASGMNPAPAQAPHPPIWIAGRGPRLLRFAAEWADWTNFARGIGADEFGETAARLRAFADEVGRPCPQLSLTGTFLGGDVERVLAQRAARRGITATQYHAELRAANAFVGSPAEIADQLYPFARAGCAAFVLWPLDGVNADAAVTLAAVNRTLQARSQTTQETARR
jgi:alkanesulfonate monooxygenase SsuD/methylene tetrahydromethanopterin reductase-like flavin-dependent oxidoreductase (luciferase family)